MLMNLWLAVILSFTLFAPAVFADNEKVLLAEEQPAIAADEDDEEEGVLLDLEEAEDTDEDEEEKVGEAPEQADETKP